MTPLKGKEKLHVLEVPEDYHDFEKLKGNILWAKQGNGNVNKVRGICGYDFLGYVTAAEVSFDCEPYVEKIEYIHTLYKNYTCNRAYMQYHFNRASDSFRSLIEKETGKSFFNPYGDIMPSISQFGLGEKAKQKTREAQKKWQQAENNRLKKCIILKEL